MSGSLDTFKLIPSANAVRLCKLLGLEYSLRSAAQDDYICRNIGNKYLVEISGIIRSRNRMSIIIIDITTNKVVERATGIIGDDVLTRVLNELCEKYISVQEINK